MKYSFSLAPCGYEVLMISWPINPRSAFGIKTFTNIAKHEKNVYIYIYIYIYILDEPDMQDTAGEVRTSL